MPDSNATAPTTTPSQTSVGGGDTHSSQTISASHDASSSNASAAAAAEEWRYKAGPGVPEWLVGKNASEAASLTQQLYHQLVSGGGPPTPGTQAYTASTLGAPPASPGLSGAPDADEFIH